MSFQRAERKRAKARIAFCGPSGSGKTKSALLMAMGMGGRIAVIDTERRSAELYSDLCEYDVAPIEDNFDPANYIKLLHEAEKEGYDIIIIDSLSHAWEGSGGILDKHDKASAADRSGNSFTAWRKITPQHNALVDAILQSPCHIIATMRTKTEYNMVEETSANGRKTTKPQKVGLKPIQREGLDYEFTTVFDVSIEGHVATASKDRTELFDGNPDKISAKHGEMLMNWLNSGASVPQKNQEEKPIAEPTPSQLKEEPIAYGIPTEQGWLEEVEEGSLIASFCDALLSIKLGIQAKLSEMLGEDHRFNADQHYFNTIRQYFLDPNTCKGKVIDKPVSAVMVRALSSEKGRVAFIDEFCAWRYARKMYERENKAEELHSQGEM